MTTPAHKPPPKPGPRRASGPARVARLLLWALPALGVLLFAAASAIAWLGRTEDGAAWLLARIPGLETSAPHGSLWRRLEIERAVFTLPGDASGQRGDRIVLQGLRWQGLSFGRATHAPQWLTLSLAQLQVERIDVEPAPRPATSKSPPRPPSSLALPIGIELPDVRIDAIHAPALGERALRALRASLSLGVQDASGREVHRVDALAFEIDRVAVRGTAQVATQPPFDVGARLAIAPAARDRGGAIEDFDAELRVGGPLDWLNVTGTLRGRLAAGRPEAPLPALDLKATLLPFAAWPIGALEAHTRALDLSALSSAAPATALTGTATLASDAASQPASLTLAFDNARPGRIDDGLLPLASLRAEARARPDDPRHVELHAIDAQLAAGGSPAGRVQGSGRWSDGSATLELTLAELRPNLLDARAPAMRLSGPVTLHADGLMDSPAAPRFALQGRIDGTVALDARERRVQLRLDAAGTPDRIQLRQASAEAGGSHATLAGQAERQAGGAWRVRANGSVADLDPALWWPGPPGSAWRRGPHRLNGRLDADLRVLTQPATAVSGHARVDLTRSVLAGVPLSGRVALDGGSRAPLAVEARLDVAGAKVVASGRMDMARGGAHDHWDLAAEDASLARLAPLLRLAASGTQPPAAIAGRLELHASVDGRWPALATRGSARLAQARLGDARLGQAQARWQFALNENAPLELHAEAHDLATGEAAAPSLARLRLDVQGTLGAQRIALDADSPLRPPAWVDALQPTPASGGSALALRAQGGVHFDARAPVSKPLRWQGRVEQLALAPHGAASAAPWLATSDAFALDLRWDPATSRALVDASPGRLQAPAGAALRWSELRWQGGAEPRLDVRAELEPIEIAPLLAKAQPDFGWRGDLAVAGRIDIHSAPRFVAAIEVARRSGDLSVRETSTSALALGLTDLRLALDANDGVWNFTGAFAGSTLGAMAAAATVRTSAERFWPPAEAPLQGVLEATVANLGAWGAWVPPGWRLGGRLHASASIGGHFGAPLYTGRVDGRELAARNLLEGIDVHDGELALSLQGETARIDKLEARAGDGRVTVSGGATFGAAPKATLKLVAERLQLLGRVDRRIVTSGRADVQLAADAIRVDGRFGVDEGLIDISQSAAPKLGDDVRVIRPKTNAPAALPAPGAAPAARRLALDVVLDLGQHLALRGRGIDTLLRGELAFTSPGDKLAVNGTLHTAEGHYAAYGQKLDVEHGLIVFGGVLDNPKLDIVALRPDLDIKVGVAISGSAQSPRVRLVSEPEMAEIDKLSWLVLGHAPEANGGSDLALLQRAALGLLQGEGKGSAGLTQRLGIDDVSLRQGSGEVKDTIVSLGKQLTQRWYVGYERGLNATAGTWQLIYRIAQRFTLRAQSGLDNSLDVIWTWRWQ